MTDFAQLGSIWRGASEFFCFFYKQHTHWYDDEGTGNRSKNCVVSDKIKPCIYNRRSEWHYCSDDQGVSKQQKKE